MKKGYVIAVHAGAGYHSERDSTVYEAALENALDAAENIIKTDPSDLFGAVSAAIASLEDAPLTNAGTGSALNLNGQVECDASVMDDQGTFAAIAAAPGIKNPIVAATRLAVDSKNPLSNGRVRPIILAGDQARKWALQNGLEAAETSQEVDLMHVTKKARQQHHRYKNIIQSTPHHPDTHVNGPEIEDSSRLQDTVGCVVVNSDGRCAAGVSSGGIPLKFPGRVGEAAVYGAGCWAQGVKKVKGVNGVTGVKGVSGVGVSVTGQGECIIRNLVARDVADLLCSTTTATSTARGTEECCIKYLEETLSDVAPPRECGILSVVVVEEHKPSPRVATVVASHYACRSMAVGVRGMGWCSGAEGAQKSTTQITMMRGNGVRGGEEHKAQTFSYSLQIG